MQVTADFFQQTSRVLTVSELTRQIRGTLETRFGAVWVQGEISNYKFHPSGHQYFTLKDQRAQIACVIFRNTIAPLRQALVDGTQVQVYGNVSVFEARGQYQLSVQILQPRGLGLLQAKFDALKRRLDAEGLFDPARKRALPRFPRRIGIVTSPSGAAIRDLLNVLRRRAPWLQILINPVRVQGSGAAAEIAVAVRELATANENWLPVDLIVVARGGGSIEDLWEFNEEIVARAIVDVSVPVVSAIAAAELIVPDIVDLRRRIAELAASFHKCLRNFVEHQKTRLRFLSERTLVRNLVARMREAQQRIDVVRESLARLTKQEIDNAGQRFRRAEGILRVLGPDGTLQRGYSITRDTEGNVIRAVRDVRPRMKIRTRVTDGEFGSEVM